jgi:hypothetical protein
MSIVLLIKSNIATPSAAAPGGAIPRLLQAAVSDTLVASASAAAAGAAIPSAAALTIRKVLTITAFAAASAPCTF